MRTVSDFFGDVFFILLVAIVFVFIAVFKPFQLLQRQAVKLFANNKKKK